MKRCTECGETKSIDEFASAGAGKKRAKCKPCLARKKREYYKENPDKARRRNLKTYYGIDVETYDLMAEQQNQCCASCEKPTENLVVDHDHETGKVRALLCTNCNLALGHFRDSIWTIENAIEYLIKHGKPAPEGWQRTTDR